MSVIVNPFLVESASAPFDPAAWLAAHMVAGWRMDGASDESETDPIGSNDLSNIQSVGSAAGILSSARTFNGVDQYLSCPSSVDLQIGGGDFLIAAWVKVLAFVEDHNSPIANKGSEYSFRLDNAHRPAFTSESFEINHSSAVSEGEWTLCVGWLSLSTNHCTVSLNGVIEAAGNTPHTPGSPGSSDFLVGAITSDNEFFNGLIDDTFIAKTNPSVVVTGAGTAAANGTYTYRGQFNGKPYYNLEGHGDNTNEFAVANSGALWQIIVPDTAEPPTFFAIYETTGNADFPWEGTWAIGGGGDSPSPTVTAYDPDALTTEQLQAVCDYVWNDGDGRVLF